MASACASVAARLSFDHAVRIGTIGGAFGCKQLRSLFVDRVARVLPDADIVEPIHEPAVGAALLARRDYDAHHATLET